MRVVGVRPVRGLFFLLWGFIAFSFFFLSSHVSVIVGGSHEEQQQSWAGTPLSPLWEIHKGEMCVPRAIFIWSLLQSWECILHQVDCTELFWIIDQYRGMPNKEDNFHVRAASHLRRYVVWSAYDSVALLSKDQTKCAHKKTNIDYSITDCFRSAFSHCISFSEFANTSCSMANRNNRLIAFAVQHQPAPKSGWLKFKQKVATPPSKTKSRRIPQGKPIANGNNKKKRNMILPDLAIKSWPHHSR